MPLSISEIAIRMAVGDAGDPAEAPTGQGNATAMTPEMMEQLVRRCTEQVLATLRAEKER
jgi:hypothetical protein